MCYCVCSGATGIAGMTALVESSCEMSEPSAWRVLVAVCVAARLKMAEKSKAYNLE